MDYIFFGVVLMHLVAGFGWMIYKLEFSRRKGGEEKPGYALGKQCYASKIDGCGLQAN